MRRAIITSLVTAALGGCSFENGASSAIKAGEDTVFQTWKSEAQTSYSFPINAGQSVSPSCVLESNPNNVITQGVSSVFDQAFFSITIPGMQLNNLEIRRDTTLSAQNIYKYVDNPGIGNGNRDIQIRNARVTLDIAGTALFIAVSERIKDKSDLSISDYKFQDSAICKVNLN